MEIKNVFFDLDHTLWDFERNSALTFELLFNKYKLDIDINSFLKVYVPINLEYWRLYRNESISKEYQTRYIGRYLQKRYSSRDLFQDVCFPNRNNY